MQQDLGASRQRAAALLAALLAHALILWALLEVPAPTPHPPVSDRLTLLYFPPFNPKPRNTMPATGHPDAQRSRIRSHGISKLPTEGMVRVSPPPPAPPPLTDWTAERQRAAESKGREIWNDLARRCHDAEALHIYPPECHRHVEPAPWEPEEQRFGLAGPLPYVRLGQCVVGLGFWGCALGKAPPPNGHLLENLRDPDRPGGVPENGRYQMPPAPREPLH